MAVQDLARIPLDSKQPFIRISQATRSCLSKIFIILQTMVTDPAASHILIFDFNPHLNADYLFADASGTYAAWLSPRLSAFSKKIWTPAEIAFCTMAQHYSIPVMECYAIIIAVLFHRSLCHQRDLPLRHLVVRTDSLTTVQAFNNSYSPALLMNTAIRRLMELSTNRLRIRLVFLPTDCNPSDIPTRFDQVRCISYAGRTCHEIILPWPSLVQILETP